MNTVSKLCYIGVGSNLSSPLDQVNRALFSLQQQRDIAVLRRAPWYRSKAIGPGDQDDYINGVFEISTLLSALDLLQVLQDIEDRQGRQRTERWGARTLDLDLLTYGNETIHCASLHIPHPRMTERNFVLAPLADLNPALTLTTAAGQELSVETLLGHSEIADLWLAEGEQEVVELRP